MHHNVIIYNDFISFTRCRCSFFPFLDYNAATNLTLRGLLEKLEVYRL